MQLSEMHFEGVLPIDGYGPGYFRIGGNAMPGPLLIRAGSVTPWGGYDDVASLLSLAGHADVVLVGTGATIAPIPSALRDPLEAAGLGVEMMSSPAACRTYNVLLSEGRRIAAALLPVG